MAQGEEVDSGEYMGGLQSIIDGGFNNAGHDPLETFFFYLYAGIGYTSPNGSGPLLGDNFIEALNYGSHPFLHAYSAHKNLFAGNNKIKQDIFKSMLKPGKSAFDKDGTPQMDRKAVRKFIWTQLMPLSTSSTAKHEETVNKKMYPKEYPGFVFSKVDNGQIESLFQVDNDNSYAPSFEGSVYNKHKSAFGQYQTGFHFYSQIARDPESYNIDNPKREEHFQTLCMNMLTSYLAVYGITHRKYYNSKNITGSSRNFNVEQVASLTGNTSAINKGILELASKLGVSIDRSTLSSSLGEESPKNTESDSHQQISTLIEAIKTKKNSDPSGFLRIFAETMDVTDAEDKSVLDTSKKKVRTGIYK